MGQVQISPAPWRNGFTLLEVMVVCGIIGLMMAGVAYSLTNVQRANLREAASRTAAAMRMAFNRALMTGTRIRLAIDIDQKQIWLEAHSGYVLDRDSDTESRASRQSVRNDEEPEAFQNAFDLEEIVNRQAELDARVMRQKKRNYSRLTGMRIPKEIKFKPKVKISFVATPTMERAARQGIAYIHFFPMGHAERAVIQFSSGQKMHSAVVLHPLTGKAQIHGCRIAGFTDRQFTQSWTDRSLDCQRVEQ